MAALLAVVFTVLGFGLLVFGLTGLQVPTDLLHGSAILIGAHVMFVAGGLYGFAKARY